MSFIVTAPGSAPAEPDKLITSSPFWPAISTADFRRTMRLDGTVTDARLQHALIYAISVANRELTGFRLQQQEAGITTLAAVPAEQVTVGDGEPVSVLVQLYLRAVYAYGHASLIERYRDYDTTGDGHDTSDKLAPAIEDAYRDGAFALREIQSLTRVTVELI